MIDADVSSIYHEQIKHLLAAKKCAIAVSLTTFPLQCPINCTHNNLEVMIVNERRNVALLSTPQQKKWSLWRKYLQNQKYMYKFGINTTCVPPDVKFDLQGLTCTISIVWSSSVEKTSKGILFPLDQPASVYLQKLDKPYWFWIEKCGFRTFNSVHTAHLWMTNPPYAYKAVHLTDNWHTDAVLCLCSNQISN